MKEAEIFSLIKKHVIDIYDRRKRPVRVAINGIEGTGKTIFANRLTSFLNDDVKTIQISIDGFHFNKEHRYRQGRDSAIGYYEDSYDERGFVEKVLIASQDEYPQITMASYDLVTDEYLNIDPIKITNDTILVTDGAYLFKPVYRAHWDLKIYLKTDFQTALSRGIKRDAEQLGGIMATKEKFDKRYHKASKIYIDQNKPEEQADIIIDNTELDDLKILKNTANSISS